MGIFEYECILEKKSLKLLFTPLVSMCYRGLALKRFNTDYFIYWMGHIKKVSTSEKLSTLGEVAAHPTSGEKKNYKQTRQFMTDDNKYDLILRGGHIQRYELLEDARQGTPIYLKTSDYLAASRKDLKAYDHTKPRVVYQEGSAIDAWRRIVSTYLPAGYICGHKVCYFIDYKIDHYCLLAIYGSKLMNWFVELLSSTNSLPADLISSLPFPGFSFDTSSNLRKMLIQQALTLVDAGDQHLLTSFIDERLNPQSEQTDVVHDVLALLAQQMINL